MTWLLILLLTLEFCVLVPVLCVTFGTLLLLLLLIWFEFVQMFSLGLSLPIDTGRGLSEHGEASRDTDSESSSLRGFPIWEKLEIRDTMLMSPVHMIDELLQQYSLPFDATPTRLSSRSDPIDLVLNIDSSESPSMPSQFSALWILIRSLTSCSSVLPPISPPFPLLGPNTSWLYRGSFTTG